MNKVLPVKTILAGRSYRCFAWDSNDVNAVHPSAFTIHEREGLFIASGLIHFEAYVTGRTIAECLK
jgi:hypothetical protein